MLDPREDERRRGPLERFEKNALTGFAVAALVQAILGVWRGGIGALAVAAGILVCGALWLLRARKMPGGVLAVPAGLLLTTIGVYAGYTASNVPFVSFLGRYAVPAVLIFTGAVLLFAEQEWSFQVVPFALAAIAFVVAQTVLTTEARAGARPVPNEQARADGGVLGELQLVPLARSFVDAVNAQDAAAIRALTTSDHRFIDARGNNVSAAPTDKITVTRWIVDDNTVVAFGTAGSTPAAFRALVRGGKIAEWQVYAGHSAGSGP